MPNKKYVSARCEKCGKVVLLGVNGVGSDSGGDLCDRCAHATRNKLGYLTQAEGQFYGPKTVKRNRS